MALQHITLLVEDLKRLASKTGPKQRHPALERIFSRGRPCGVPASSPHHLRFRLFGIEPEGALPVAALTHVNDRQHHPRDDYFWLRADPVTMWSDMAQAFMSSHGFADLDPYERNEIENCIRGVFIEEGIQMHSDHPERWCIALERPLNFEFTPLDEALGMNFSDALPHHPEALHWRRILNEIQVALHNCPVNVRRRQTGRQEINSVWFWGGGFIPDAAPHDVFDTVYSDHAVTRGLAIINDCRLRPQAEAEQPGFHKAGRTVLIDWTAAGGSPDSELERVEWLVRPLAERVRLGEAVLTLVDGDGEGGLFDSAAQRRFWRRRKALPRLFPAAAGP
ncbi:MAG: hypothetical protein HKP03_05725 [Xanthomonadales bacterium]|nr:hypothetical protein [Xanthomonadales bacterium]